MLSETIYKKKEGISSRRLGSDLMLYDETLDKVHILNETGALIWELLNGENNLSKIKNLFIRRLPGNQPDEISRDIEEATEKLLSQGLIICM